MSAAPSPEANLHFTNSSKIQIVSAELLARHPELHHYTTAAGLRGIFESRTIRATYFANLNDATEVMLLREPLVNAVQYRFREILRQSQRESLRVRRAISQSGGLQKAAGEVARDLVDSVYKVTFESGGTVPFGDPFIASFCAHSNDQEYEQRHGLLSQWRAYGVGGGFCIVFDTKGMADLLGFEFDHHYWIHLKLAEVHYALDGVSVSDLFPDLLDRFDFVLRNVLRTGTIGPSPDDGFAPFVRAATLLKHQGFREEREVRIVAMAGTAQFLERVKAENHDFIPSPIKAIREVEGDRGRRRYISLFEELDAALPIRRIIIGPSRDQDANYESARSIVGDAAEVSRSATPYIG